MAEKIINLIATHRSQTRGLAVETWQQIFWDASHIDGVEEFTTRAGAHNRLEWDNRSGKPGAARVPGAAFNEAFETRRRIILVCKAWYTMGIEIMYSHLRISSSQWKGDTLSKLSKDCHRLLAYTKRLAVQFEEDKGTNIVKPVMLIRRFALLCSNLTRLKIIEAPSHLLTLFPLTNLPTTLEVAIFDPIRTFPEDQLDNTRLPFPAAVWTNVRVLDIETGSLEFCTLDDFVVFPVLEDLRVREPWCNTEAGEMMKERGVRYIANKWTAPRLKSLTIVEVTWPIWSQFLRRHNEMLTTLCFFGIFDMTTLYGYEGEDGDLELPNLRTLYHDWFKNLPDSFIANGVERIGIHELGYRDMDTLDAAVEKLCRTFDVWSCYPNIKSCCLSGWEPTIELLEDEPKVVEFVAEMKKKGITVDFIRLADDDLGY